MPEAVTTADPAAPATGNAPLLSATGEPPAPPADPTPPVTEPPKEGEPPAEPPKEGEGEGEAAKGPPDQYAFTAPEGVTLDAAAVEAFTPVAKELGLSQEQAQRVVDLYAGLQQRQVEAQAAQAQQWIEQVRADKEIGGARMVEQVEIANQALDRFGSPGLKEVLKHTGLSNHPEMVRLFARVGRAIADDSLVTSGRPVTGPRTAEDFYARMPKIERVS